MSYRVIVKAGLTVFSLAFFSGVFPGPRNSTASHFQAPSASPAYCDYLGTSFRIGGEDAQPGDEVAFFDPDGILCGVYVVQNPGIYGIVHVYGDDPTTPDRDEGARPGDTLTVRVWDQSAGREYSGADVELLSGDPPPSSSFLPASLPITWEDRKGFVLNIRVAPGASEPQPGIRANYIADALAVDKCSPISISISLDPGDRAGQTADWWVAAHTPFSPPADWYSYVHPTGWQPGIRLSAQAPLFEIVSPFEVLRIPLPVGTYTFYFAIDGNADGFLDATWYDSVQVNVQ